MLLKLLSYPRSIVATILLPIHTLLSSIAMIIVSSFPNSRRAQDAVVVYWTKGACVLFGVRVVVLDQHNIPTGGFIFVFNHTSFFDIFAMNGYLGSFRFGAKIELFKIPVFGWAMRRAGILPIARDRREEVFKVYREAEVRIRAGERFALAPEGTRQKSEVLGPFKSGPFVFAINAKAPLVPVVVRGAASIMKKGQIFPNWGVWSRTVTLRILPAVHAENYRIEDRPQLQERVRSMMAAYF
jgi:1-acyl-sn-glycerol-3-phosphate acyltransferase